jgi:hypothetical protein
MREKYKITTQDRLNNFAGLHLTYNRDNSITVSQPGYTNKIIDEYTNASTKASSTPAASKSNDPNKAFTMRDIRLYLRLLGLLIFLIKTRPDIAFAVSAAGTKSANPTDQDYENLLKIVFYLKGNATAGITYHSDYPNAKRNDNDKLEIGDVVIVAHADASFNIHSDSRSHTGFMIALGKYAAPIESISKKQSRICLSSTESEHEAIFELTKSIIWWRELLEEIGFEQKDATIIYEDNLSTITLVKNPPSQKKRSKHYCLRINYVHEQFKNEIIDLQYVSTEDQKADILTKPLDGGEMRRQVKLSNGNDERNFKRSRFEKEY